MTAHDPDLARCVSDLRTIELERDDAARKALDEAANELELLGGADQYQRAYRKAADFLRAFRWRGNGKIL